MTDRGSTTTGFSLVSATLRVPDAGPVAAFYESVVGLPGLTGPDGAPLLHLVEDAAAPPRGKTEPGLYHLAFLYPTREALGAAIRRVRAAGLPLSGAADHAVSEAVYLDDPAGNGVELYVDRPSEAWPRLESGLIAMVNERLDVDGLAALPAPTTLTPPTLGHVHLDVGDVAEAEAFYADALPFETQARFPAASFLGADGYHHHLGVNTWRSEGAGPTEAAPLGLVEIVYRAARSAPAALTDPWGIAWRRSN